MTIIFQERQAGPVGDHLSTSSHCQYDRAANAIVRDNWASIFCHWPISPRVQTLFLMACRVQPYFAVPGNTRTIILLSYGKSPTVIILTRCSESYEGHLIGKLQPTAAVLSETPSETPCFPRLSAQWSSRNFTLEDDTMQDDSLLL